MPRRPRALEGNVVYHVYNRRNEKQCLFRSDDDYARFLLRLRKTKERYPIRLHAYCLMRTHWHLALSAEVPETISQSIAWLAGNHAMEFRAETGTVGLGHVYQGRYGSVAADGIVHYVRLIRYIEANPREAGLVLRAEDWQWSSLRERGIEGSLLDAGPWTLPSDWTTIVNTPDVKVEMLSELLGQAAAFRPEPLSFH